MAGKMTFNLGGTQGTAIVRLKAWGIYDVVFRGIEVVKGTNKEGQEWKAMKVKFSGDEGIFEPMIFCPKENGDERPHGENNGKPWELPSSLEILQFSVAHILDNLAPEYVEKFNKLSLALPEEFDKLVETLSKALVKATSKKVKIKLCGDKKGYAVLPKFVNINKEGDAYISSNWLGDTVAFSAYELDTMKRFANAKPSTIKDDEDTTEESKDENTDLDFDLL